MTAGGRPGRQDRGGDRHGARHRRRHRRGAARRRRRRCTGSTRTRPTSPTPAQVRGLLRRARRRGHPGQQRRRRLSGRSATRWRRSPSDDWRAVVDANLTSTFLCTRAVVPAMKERRWGRIVNISSAAGLHRQPDRDPGVRQRQGGPDRVHPADGARTRAVRHHGQLHRPRLRPVQPDHRAAVGELRRGGPGGAGAGHRHAAARRARGHRQRRAVLRLASGPPG